jgi:hypothetical protein
LATPDDPINRRRSERVVLQMKITVIAEDVQHNSRQEEALTQVVNAHGGLLKMKMDVHVGTELPGGARGRHFHGILLGGLRVCRSQPQVLAGGFSALGLGRDARMI